MFFLQANVTLGDTLAEASSGEVTIRLWDLILMGGWAMIVLVILFIAGVYIFVERYITLNKASKLPSDLMQRVREYVLRGEVKEALTYCEAQNTPYARLIARGLKRLGSPLPEIASAIENEGKLELHRLENTLAYLATISGASPMIGFLGTVTGMIKAFMKISTLHGNVDPSALADGIYQAMITTAAGLIVGIPAYIGYNILVNKLNNIVYKMEATSTEFINLLQEPVK